MMRGKQSFVFYFDAILPAPSCVWLLSCKLFDGKRREDHRKEKTKLEMKQVTATESRA